LIFVSHLVQGMIMKSILSLIACCVLLVAGCTKDATQPLHTTQPTSTDTIKQDYYNLTNALIPEVEQFRGKTYKRSIHTAVYTRDQYRALTGSQNNSQTPAYKAQYNAICRRENLLRPTQDYFAEYDSLSSSMVGGFYVPGTDSIYIVLDNDSAGPTHEDSVALFHELIHAMQDQYYNLTSLQQNRQSSDQYWAFDYTVEGEAELLCTYYDYKLYYGNYPSVSTPIMNAFNFWQLSTDTLIDSLHQAGEPVYASQPMLWAYYSYGPTFIDAIAGTNWSLIDSKIFASLPLRTCEVMHPALFSTANEYLMDAYSILNSLDSTQVILDVDELGEMLTDVVFREWNFANYRQIAQGLTCDNIIVYRGTQDDTLRLAWITAWSSQSACDNFMSSYIQLVNRKRSITLPSSVQNGMVNTVSDSVNHVYIECNNSSFCAIVLEDYPTQNLSAFVNGLRLAKPYLNTGSAKRIAQSKRFAFVDKSKFAGRPQKRRGKPAR